jgi:hypothetical protein
MTRAQKKDFRLVPHSCPSGLGLGIWLDALLGRFFDEPRVLDLDLG